MTKKNKSAGKFISYMRNLSQEIEKVPVLRGKTPEESMLILKCVDGHTHVFHPKDRQLSKVLLNEALEELNYFPSALSTPTEKSKLPKKIVFHNRQAIGDILMFTAGVRDFKAQFPDIQVQVRSTAMHLWDYNPLINKDPWADVLDPVSYHEGDKKATDVQMLEYNQRAVKQAAEEDRPVQVYIGPGKATNASNVSNNHFANAFRISMETVLQVSIPQGPIRPDIYMSEHEYNAPPLIEPPYWLITAGEKGDWTAKTYPFSFWDHVVKSMPNIKFVQIGATGHKHPDLQGPNVINLIGQTQSRNTGVRDLFNLFNNCEGSAGLLSFQMHLAAAFNKPAVVISGAREPVWFTRYPGQQYLATDGCLPCTIKDNGEPTACWFCDVNRCPHTESIPSSKKEEAPQKVPKCASLIRPQEVMDAIGHYYSGGRLDLKKISGKSKLVKVVKAPEPLAASKVIPVKLDKDNSMWGFAWGGSSITDKDWEFISTLLLKEKVKKVLEFGSGLSTLLMKGLGIDVVSFETRQKDIDRLKAINPTVEIRLWDGTFEKAPISTSFSPGTIPEKFDLALVDGPGGGENREASFKIAAMYADKILVHDGGRAPEKKWAEKHLKPKFSEYSRGGHRTIFFKLQKEIKEEKAAIVELNKDKPLVKVVFNGRGEGGAEHSTTWIMNQFIEKGWAVEYISPNSAPSGTFKKEGNLKHIPFTSDLSKIKEPCDILFLYANDWIWELKTDLLKNAFSNLQAKRKVMAANYRLGDIGSRLVADWTIGWDKYLFLNSSLQATFQERVLDAKTKAMAPPIDLSPFLEIQPNYEDNLRIVRHSSQDNNKYAKDFSILVDRILSEIPNSEIFLMPAPSFLEVGASYNGRVHRHQKNKPPVKDFLAQGNVFWYHLPKGYTDQGPKVIMEAQAAGLPIIADNHSGAKDRVVGESGFLCNDFEEHLNALKLLGNHPETRHAAGNLAREHAKKEYDPQNWIKEIIG